MGSPIFPKRQRMPFDMEAYKAARLKEAESQAREDLAKTVVALHERIEQLEQSMHTKLTRSSKR
jgi:hypothetical protein